MATEFDTYCGLSCANCEWKEAYHCGGCIATGGKPFHGECDIANCATKNKRRFCGECENFPCENLKRYSYDPEHGDEGMRIENCKVIKRALVEEGREGVNPVSICGHHCDYCFYGQWCSGCRSTYNCCSYATISEGGICPNVKCANEKKLNGCFECDELDRCQKGFYSVENEYVAKATALFIREYGEKIYTETLVAAINANMHYPKSFDETGSVEAAYELLKSFLKEK